MNRFSIINMTFVSAAVVLISACSWISLPFAVPVTLQTLGVFAVVGLLGTGKGVLSVIVYIALGMIGLPVFSGFSSGASVIAGPTGGYITGFVFAALITGILISKFGKSTSGLVISMAAGLAVCYLFGSLWFMYVYAERTGEIGFYTALSWCVLPFILPDAVKLVLAAFLVRRLRPLIQKLLNK